VSTLQEKLQRSSQGTEEIITEEELEALLLEKRRPRAYWGFECSGPIHIGMGLVVGKKIREIIDAGFDFIVFLADWHSWINNKFGGDLEKIRLAGEYFKEGFKALGIHGDRVKFLWSSDLVEKPEYWEKVIRIAKRASLNRVIRTLPIMGRKETSKIEEVAWLIYPLMQAADIFELEVDVACAGIDQRKVHVLAREVAKYLGFKKPILLHTPLLPSLAGPVPKDTEEIIDTKMSKSKKETCIFIHDPPEVIRRKINAGYCPPKSIDDNPFFYLLKLIIFRYFDEFEVKREIRYGGDITYESYEEVIQDYINGKLHPADLKSAIADHLIKILEPVRRYFKGKEELISLVMKG